MEGNRGDKKGSKVPGLGSDWGVASDRNPTETISSPGHPGTVGHHTLSLRANETGPIIAEKEAGNLRMCPGLLDVRSPWS